MSVFALVKKNFFLLVFFITGISYAYFNYIENSNVAFYLKPLIVLSLLVQYYTAKKSKYNIFFIIALFFALSGDIFFNYNSEITHIIAMASFLMFLLFLMIVITYAAKEIKFNGLLLTSVPFLIILIVVSYFFIDFKNIMSGIYLVLALVIAVLCSFSFYFHLKERNKKSRYYFIGCLLFILTGFARMMNEFYGLSNPTKLLNNTTYIFSLFFFYLGSTTYLETKEIYKSDGF